MTRLVSLAVWTLPVALPALAAGQNYPPNPAAGQRYAPAPPAGQSVYGPRPSPSAAPAGAQPAAGGYPVRPVGGQQAAAQPGYPAPVGMPAGGTGYPPAAGVPQGAMLPGGAAPAMPRQPDWVGQMSPAEQKWVDDMLRYWESRSDQIKLFECKFERWDYDPVFGPRDKAKTYAKGVIKYAQPEKGLYRVESLASYVQPTKPGEEGKFVVQDATFGEHWVCDGERIFEFDARNKRLIERPLPPEMRGRALADGPLPFMFGARAETIKARYWIRREPSGGADKYWLEAVPKARQDAQNFSRVIIALHQQEFLPESIQVFAPNFDPVRNPSKQSYVFSERKTADPQGFANALARNLDPLGLFFKQDDFNPKVPAGWKRVVQDDTAALPPLEAKAPAAPPRAASPIVR